MIHSLPVCRESLFITNVLSGICFLIIPQAIAFLGGVLICFLEQMTHLKYLMHWLLLSSGMAVFAFALAILMVMITGNMIAAPIFFLISNYLFVGLRSVIMWFINTLSYGITNARSDFGDWLSPYYFLTTYFSGFLKLFLGGGWKEISIVESYTYVGGYCVAGLLLLVLSFVIYKKKHLETAGDIITLPLLKPVFRWGATFCIGSCLTLWGYSWFVTNELAPTRLLPLILAMVISCIIIFFLTEMALQKRFFVFCKKRLIECGAFLAFMLVFVIGTELNIFGLETRIPQETDIQAIYFSGSYPINVDEEDFSKVLSIHQSTVESKGEFENYFQKYSTSYNSTYIDIIYTLKNGSILSRSYVIPVEDYYLEQPDYVFNQIDALSHNPEYYLRYHFTDAYESITFMDASLDLYTGGDYLESVTVDQVQCKEIYEAFKKDIHEGNYHIYDYAIYNTISEEIYYNTLYFTYYAPIGSTYASYSGAETVQRNDTLQGTSITLTADCVHTLQALTDMGILNDTQQMITQKEADAMYRDDVYEDIEYH